MDTAAVFMRELKGLGVRLALDRFGAGLSALGCLRRLPIDVLKLDRCLWGGVSSAPADRAVVNAVVGLAGELDLRTTATGVEDVTTRVLLAAAGVDFVQGGPIAAIVDVERDDEELPRSRAVGG